MQPIVGVDTETVCFGPGNKAPPLVCTSICDARAPRLYHAADGPEPIEQLFRDAVKGQYLIAGHNFAYDAAVFMAQWPHLIDPIFAAYDTDRVIDTMLRQKLYDIADGCFRGWTNAATDRWVKHSYGLGDLAQRHLGRTLVKDNPWRMQYAELLPVPLEHWPESAYEYAVDDAEATRDVAMWQEAESERRPGILEDEFRQTRAALALHLASVWGMRTDAEGVAILRASAERELDEVRPILLEAGLLRPNGSRNVKAAGARMLEVNPDGRKTDTGRPSLDEDACMASGDKILQSFTVYSKAQNILANAVRAMEEGIDKPIHTSFDSLVETGRTSSSAPNIQNQRRREGVRECWVPRPGYLFAACDFDKAELHTLAQVCLTVLGYSRLAERLNEGFDPHLDLGAQILGISYEDALERKGRGDKAIKQARQHAKPANFGFPGGMGVQGFLIYARRHYGIDFEYKQAASLRATWLENWPEMNDYFAWIQILCGQAGFATICHLFSNRQRGLIPYPVACNSFFQGLAADGAKAAMWRVCQAQYSQPDSPLFGSRTVNFIHDELLIETPEKKADAAARELQRVMVNAFNPWVPDVPVRASVALMRRWYKDAEPAYNEDGKLIPWEPRKAA
jgi:DNA polymerase-1